jgi:3',5'-cyclic AMP phosphodiesterase CpdA
MFRQRQSLTRRDEPFEVVPVDPPISAAQAEGWQGSALEGSSGFPSGPPALPFFTVMSLSGAFSARPTSGDFFACTTSRASEHPLPFLFLPVVHDDHERRSNHNSFFASLFVYLRVAVSHPANDIKSGYLMENPLWHFAPLFS